MKKLWAVILVFVLTASSIPFHATAYGNENVSAEYIYYEDGSFLVISIQTESARSTMSRTGTKIYQHYASDGTAQWKAVLRGIFYYDGESSRCSSSVCDVTIYNSEWYTISKNVRTSGNSALTDLTMGRTLLGVKVEQRTVNMSLSCDVNGNLY